MPKIQSIGVGNYIKNPRGRLHDGGVSISDVLYVYANEGTSIRVYRLKDKTTTPPTLDYSYFLFLPLDTEVEQAWP